MIEIIKDSKVQSFEKKTEFSAGYDLHNIDGDLTIHPMQTVLVDTGITLNMMKASGHVAALVLPRSGVSLKTHLRICNAPGLIDQDYRGKVKVIIQNIDQNSDVIIKDLDRIAQLVFININCDKIEFVDKFEDTTDRGAGGFGSTGK